ncbi:MAG: VOC family protein [Ignavibacteria bacterium]
MSTKIFVNLAVKDLNRSMDFFKAIGYSFNLQFTDETAACMVITDDIYAMLITESKFKEFTPKKIADATTSTEVLTCLSAESKDKVNEIVDKAIKAGATELKEPQDHGSMFYRSFNDLDGHIWEILWMDESSIQK